MHARLHISEVASSSRVDLVDLIERRAASGAQLELVLEGREWTYPLQGGAVAYLVLDLLVLGEGVAPWCRGVQWDLDGEGPGTEARLFMRPAAPRELADELQWQARGHAARRAGGPGLVEARQGRDFEAHYRAFQLDLDRHVRRFDTLAQLFLHDVVRTLPFLCCDAEQEAAVLERLQATASRFLPRHAGSAVAG